MVMKDKLEKRHHKGLYYRIRRFFMVTVFGASITAAILIPTYIANGYRTSNATNAQEEVVEKEDEQETNSVQPKSRLLTIEE